MYPTYPTTYLGALFIREDFENSLTYSSLDIKIWWIVRSLCICFCGLESVEYYTNKYIAFCLKIDVVTYYKVREITFVQIHLFFPEVHK